MAYVMPQVPVMTQPVMTQPVMMAPLADVKRDGPNMGNKQNVYVWVSDECGCCNDCCICKLYTLRHSTAFANSDYAKKCGQCKLCGQLSSLPFVMFNCRLLTLDSYVRALYALFAIRALSRLSSMYDPLNSAAHIYLHHIIITLH